MKKNFITLTQTELENLADMYGEENEVVMLLNKFLNYNITGTEPTFRRDERCERMAFRSFKALADAREVKQAKKSEYNKKYYANTKNAESTLTPRDNERLVASQIDENDMPF